MKYFLLIFLIPISCFSQEAPSPLLSSFDTYMDMKRETLFGLEWISLGPVLNSARVEAVQLDPTHPGTIYAAFGSGNLWKTTNNGLHWKPIFEDQASLGIGDIALAPSNPNILYVGTGESLKKARNFTMTGSGIYRSEDAGETWKHLGLEDSWHIGEIVVHPTNPDIVLVAVMGHFWSTNKNRGIYRTENGGKSWEHVLYIDEKTAANDLVISPANPDRIYASMWENNPSIYGPNSGIYTSSDGGKSWTKCSLDLGKHTGRIGLAVSYQNPLKAYALVDNLNKNKQKSAEIYKTVDGGKNWTKTHEQDLLFFPGIGWYFTDLYVDPENDEEIYGLGVRLAHSEDGGKSFNYLGGDVFHMFPSAADHLHLDHCELFINPFNPAHLVLGNDGGVYQSYDKGQSWFHFNNIPTGEFYTISVDTQNPYNIYAGAQDDATVMGPAVEWNPAFADRWKYLWIDAWSGGDGCYTQIDPEDPNTVYFSMQHGAVRRKDMAMDTSISIRPKLPSSHPGNLSFNFVAPYFISPHHSKTLYIGGNYVLKSNNKGENWEVISPDLSLSADSQKYSVAAGALVESKLREGLLYMGTDKGAFWTSKNGSESWTEYSTGLPNNYIRSIYPSQHKESRVYLTLNGMNYDDLNAYVYVSENYGKKWKSLLNNLPNETANVIVEDPVFENILYLGMYRGVYISMNKGKSWSLLGKNMAATAIADIKIHAASKDLIVATHGRGIYKVNLAPIHEAYALGKKMNQNFLFRPPVAIRPKFNDTHKDPDYKSIQKLPITFYLTERKSVELKIKNGQGTAVWSETLSGSLGYNQLRWDQIVKKEKSLNPYFIHYDKFIEAGTYTLILSINEQELIQKLEVRDP